MRTDLQWSWAQAGSINTVNAFGYLLGALLTRSLIRRLGNRRLFIAGMVLTSILLMATGLYRDLPALTVIRVLTGIGGATIFICGGALSGNIFVSRPELATTTIAIYFAGAGIGLMGCGVVIPLALDAFGDGAWVWMWRGMGLVSLLMSIASAWAAWSIVEPGEAVKAAEAGKAPTSARGADFWPWRPFIFEFASYAMFSIGYIGYMTFVVAWIRLNGGDTATVAAVWVTLGLATLMAPLLWRKPAQNWRGGLPLAAVMAMLAAGSAIVLVANHPAAMFASAALFGAAMFSAPSSVSSLIKRSLPKPAWGSAMATFTAVFAAGQIIGPLAIGELADRTGSLAPGLAASVVVLAIGSVLALFQPDPKVYR